MDVFQSSLGPWHAHTVQKYMFVYEMALRPLHKFLLLVGRATGTSGLNECYNV